MDDRCKSLREAIERSRAGKIRWRCPPGLRSEVVAFTRERQAAGEGVGKIARDVGLSESGLSRWLRLAEGGFRQVRIGAESASNGDLVLVTPRGFRLEGLSEGLAVRLLREL